MRLTTEHFNVFFSHVAYVRLICDEERKRLLDILAAEKSIPDNSCIQNLSWTSYDTRDISGFTTRGITIDNLWKNNTARQLKCHNCRLEKGDIARRMILCAKNLREGKCTDTFMRRTIGAALFPQFYGKTK